MQQPRYSPAPQNTLRPSRQPPVPNGGSAPRYQGAPAPPAIKGNQRPSGPAMTSPAGAINAPYRGASWTPQGYAPAQQAYRYTTPLAQQPAYAYTQHTTTTTR